MVKTVEGTLGPVTLLVNTAGSGGVSGPIWVVDPDDWWRCVDVNLRGPFLCSRGVLPGMVERKRGCIVNVSSGTGRQPWLHVSTYAISKAALTCFTESLAQETQPYHVHVFAMAPGLVHTAMADLTLSPEWQKWDTRVVDLLTEGADRPPEDVAELVAMLATGKAEVLSGCLIDVSYDLDHLVARSKDIDEGAL